MTCENDSGGGGITVYTDGGAHNNPGPGAYAAIITIGDKETRLSGSFPMTTGNKMELMAAIKALSFIREHEELCSLPIDIYCDSTYLKDGITIWINTWRQNGFITSKKAPVVNKDLWLILDELNTALKPTWHHVKGHAGIPGNEACDKLCTQEIKKLVDSTKQSNTTGSAPTTSGE